MTNTDNMTYCRREGGCERGEDSRMKVCRREGPLPEVGKSCGMTLEIQKNTFRPKLGLLV